MRVSPPIGPFNITTLIDDLNNAFAGRGGVDFLDSGAGDDWIDTCRERNCGHVFIVGGRADTFNFLAPSSWIFSGRIVDFDAKEDRSVIVGQEGLQHVGLTPHRLFETEYGSTVNLIGGAQITFAGISVEEQRARIADLIVGERVKPGQRLKPRPCKTCHRPARWCAAPWGLGSSNGSPCHRGGSPPAPLAAAVPIAG